MTPSIATIAASQFERRRAHLARRVAAGRLAATEANQRALPWLAIAAMAASRSEALGHKNAGADLPELWHEVTYWFLADTAGARQTPAGWVRRERIPACDISPRAEALAELARARDIAVAAALKQRSGSADQGALEQRSDAANREATELTTLSIALGAPLAVPAGEQRKAA